MSLKNPKTLVYKDEERILPSLVHGDGYFHHDDDINIFGLHFAPLSLPLERRLQTAAVAFYVWIFMFSWSFTVLALYLIFTYTHHQWIVLLYLSWLIFDKDVGETGGRTIRWARTWWIWNYFRDYFPAKVIKTAELDPEKSYILGYHPHGIMSFGCFITFATTAMKMSKLFPGIMWKVVTLPIQFILPGQREIVASHGTISSTKSSLETQLSIGKGQGTVIVIGGASEALNYHTDSVELYLKRRMGFIKLALRFGRDLVPVFCFGENFIYGQAPNPEGSKLRKFQRWFEKNMSFSPPIFYGRGIFQYNFGLLPFRKPLNIVIGQPIPVQKVEEPTSEDIVQLHQNYVNALQKLYEEYNPKYGDPNVKLIIS